MDEAGRLRRRLGLGDAVVIGVGSMVGAGVFTVWAPAAGAAGTGLLIGLVIAGLVAFANATSSAQLAARHPESGGTYVYGRARLGPAWGHLAGWGFVVGKTASCAAMALTVGAYLWPAHERAIGAGAVVVLVGVNLLGVTRTAAMTRVLLVVSLAALAVVVIAGWSSGDGDVGRITPMDTSPLDVLRSAGFLFFAFAGYARIATLGEEVREPATTIPKAIPRALGAVLVLYLVIAVTVLAVVPVDALANTDAPLRLVVEAAGAEWLDGIVRVGAGIAALGVLLNLLAGISRTALAMARQGDLPRWLDAVDERRSVPHHAEWAVGVVVLALVVLVDLRDAIAFSSVGVLVYYAVTNASALRLDTEERRWPAWIAVGGLVGCLVLALTLPAATVAVGLGVLAVGVVGRTLLRARARPAG
jgi:APA family basic amino acid/polyamine antiporter